ncbi:MAG: undecaprenyldiphospho-muramoylpentapeptide beta-N-acetylglucosaminyltransferase [Parafilimonas sp.]|nr:undecaprenyldiphospho-muramoylpentapeptide beta-N-acetylglucosaminyltransferase [Parafilimonas sp.]
MNEVKAPSPLERAGGEVTKKIIIAGGGTGGHIFPAIAIANAIKEMQPQTEILFVGATGKMEMEKVPQAGYKIKGLTIAGYDRSSLIKNIWLPFKLVKSFLQVRKIFKNFFPDAVIGVGGYSSFPVLKTAQQKGIKTFIHESNSFAGKSNIMLGKKATKIFVATEGMDKFFPVEKIVVTGNPVRKSIAESKVTKEEALQFFGLANENPTVLVFGGSLGAKSINEVMSQHVLDFNPLDLQLIWQTGKTTAAKYLERAKPVSNVWANDFINEMDKAYAAADIVVSRSGAMTVAELCVAKKPVIFVPFPFAAEDHQTVNAKYLVDKNAALMVKDEMVNARLFSEITTLAKDKAKQEDLSNNISAFAIKNADKKIAEEILKSIGE